MRRRKRWNRVQELAKEFDVPPTPEVAQCCYVGLITDTGRWPVQREFNRRMVHRFRELEVHLFNPMGG